MVKLYHESQMPTLTEAAIFSKRAFRWFLIGIALIVVIVILVNVGKSAKNNLFPKGPAPPSVAFGKLPAVDFAEGIKPPNGVNYGGETISGDLPALATSAKVFTVSAAEVTFGDLERAKINASKIGFTDQPVEISQGKAKFIDPRRQDRKFTIQTASGQFILESNHLTNPDIIASRPGSQEGAREVAKEFMNNFVKATDYPDSKIEAINFKIDSGKLVEAPVFSATNVVQVNLIRADIDTMPIIYPHKDKPKVSIVVSTKGVESAKYFYLNLQKHKFATYPLKGTKQAYEDLKTGKAAYNKPFAGSPFVIRDVILGYLE